MFNDEFATEAAATPNLFPPSIAGEQTEINPTQIVPVGPLLDLTGPHGRG